jgi:zinc protease
MTGMTPARRLALAGLLLVVPGAPAAAPIARREVLPNGIVLLVSERPAVPIVAVRAYFRAGSAFDPPDAPGLANLTASLLTRGTTARTGEDIDRAIESVGGGLEAAASRDGITVSLAVLRKDLASGLDLLADVVRRPSFPEPELARRKKETQAGIQRSEESPNAVADRELMRLVYLGHPYGHPVEGTRESVGALTREQVLGYYAGHIRPDTAIIAVVGAVSLDEARREIVVRFGDWSRPAPQPPAAPAGPATSAPQASMITRDLSQTTVAMGRRAIRQDDPDYFALVVAGYILGGGMNSRLYVRVREEHGLAYAVYSHVVPGRYGSAALVGLQTRTAEAARALAIARAEMARLAREPVSPRELELAKAYLVGSFPLRLDTSSKVSNFLVGVEEQGLGLDYAERFRQRIAGVMAEDVRRVAARYLEPETFAVVTVGKPAPLTGAR